MTVTDTSFELAQRLLRESHRREEKAREEALEATRKVIDLRYELGTERAARMRAEAEAERLRAERDEWRELEHRRSMRMLEGVV